MKIAIFGYGTVGSGVFDVINMNSDIIAKRAGKPIEVKYVLDLRDFPGDPVEKVLVHDVDIILNDPEVKIIAEVMGGMEPAFTFTKRALSAGKSVCTSNKELVAAHGAELIELAAKNNCDYYFEASVGGGIPIIRSLCDSLVGDDIIEIKGIVNGTTNYILTRMGEDGLDFNVALKEAQDNGFAERNPAADIEGTDAQRKAAILASLAAGAQVDCDDIPTEGIVDITAEDIASAKGLGAKIKLLASIRRDDEKISAMVAPFLVFENCQLYHVNNVFNGILVTGNATGEVMFYGKGAGKLPTAGAVAGDIIEAAKYYGIPSDIIWDRNRANMAEQGSSVGRFYVRLGENEAMEARKVLGVTAESTSSKAGEVAFITEAMSEADFNAKIEKIKVLSKIRVYD
ncbi:MAG: homoserine dehydrogenase [Lachnospiraceae bacterium]|nr:homoserine dehydrogenase [Lachnospiraceae bacterium]